MNKSDAVDLSENAIHKSCRFKLPVFGNLKSKKMQSAKKHKEKIQSKIDKH